MFQLETMNIILNRIFTPGVLTFQGCNSKEFKTILELCFTSSYFKFNDKIYKQLDGLSMGGPVSPEAANIFLNSCEIAAMTDCPIHFKPKFYMRYLDDSFLLFDNEQQARDFFHYNNNRHKCIKFTFEGEVNKSLSFLDMTIVKENNAFHTSIFRKATFTGLGLNYFSNIFYQYKISTINTLINRAFALTSSYGNFHHEVNIYEIILSTICFPIICSIP